MSASSVRRSKDRTGAGASNSHAVKQSKTSTPVSSSAKSTGGDAYYRSSSSGKENPRPTFRASSTAQKPMIRPVPRIDKTSAIAMNGGETHVRRSASSVPRGRSSSPSDFVRTLSDVRRDRRVSVDRSEKGSVGERERVVLSGGKGSSGVRGSERSKQKSGFRESGVNATEVGLSGLTIFRDFKENYKLEVIVDKKSEGSEGMSNNYSEVNLSSNLIDSNKCDLIGNSVNCKSGTASRERIQNPSGVNEQLKEESGSVFNTDGAVGKKWKGVYLDESSEKSVKDSKVLEIPKEKSFSKEGIGSCVGNKYPSKLHEKLAFLEGKVKRIASDIKRTKEILDMNNPDASKVILSDIQNKISGIEKAMGNVAGDSDGKVESLNVNERETKIVGEGQTVEAANVKNPPNGLNTKELEERLFPHHKLLRNRVSVKTSSAISQGHELQVVESNCEMKAEDMSLIPIDENPIALEFLASLNKEQMKVTVRNEQVGLEFGDVQEMDDGASPVGLQDSSDALNGKQEIELILTTDETLDEFDDQENKQEATIGEEIEDTCLNQLKEIGFKSSTGGWFVSEGEAVLLAHDDNSCSFYDITNSEEKAEYKPPAGISPNMWRDCWIIRAPGADGCSGRYVVAASAGNSTDSGFCSWDFYTKDVRAFQHEDGGIASRAVLAPLRNNVVCKRNVYPDILVSEAHQWWYRPCGPLIISTASCQKAVKIYDIRDGEEVMKWDAQKPVSNMDYSSPLQWRNRGKVVIAEAETLSVWDVNSLNPHALLSLSSSGRKISALHVNNTDAELGGGVRQRVSTSEAEGNDGVFCTPDSINIMDFRHPSGVGLKIPKVGVSVQSVFSRGDSIFIGCSNSRSGGKKQPSAQVQQFSLRKQRLFSTYVLPESTAHFHHTTISQVWGNSNLVMAVNGLGLFVFDALKDDTMPFSVDYGNTQNVRETVGPDDLYSPSFDYLASRVLLISRDRPALWRHLS